MNNESTSELSKFETSKLVSMAILRRQRLKFAQGDLARVEAELIARGAGKYEGGAGKEITVAAAAEPAKKARPLSGPEQVDEAREICGASFSDLFQRVEIFEPKSGFLDRADVLFSAGQKRRLFALCVSETRGKASYVIYPKEGK